MSKSLLSWEDLWTKNLIEPQCFFIERRSIFSKLGIYAWWTFLSIDHLSSNFMIPRQITKVKTCQKRLQKSFYETSKDILWKRNIKIPKGRLISFISMSKSKNLNMFNIWKVNKYLARNWLQCKKQQMGWFAVRVDYTVAFWPISSKNHFEPS